MTQIRTDEDIITQGFIPPKDENWIDLNEQTFKAISENRKIWLLNFDGRKISPQVKGYSKLEALLGNGWIKFQLAETYSGEINPENDDTVQLEQGITVVYRCSNGLEFTDLNEANECQRKRLSVFQFMRKHNIDDDQVLFDLVEKLMQKDLIKDLS